MGFGEKRKTFENLLEDKEVNNNLAKESVEEDYKRVGTSVTIREDVLNDRKKWAKANRISFSRLIEDLLIAHSEENE